MKKLKKIKSNFVHIDDKKGHIVACGDVTNVDFLLKLINKIGKEPDLFLADPPYGISSDNTISIKGRTDIFLNEEWDKLGDNKLINLLMNTIKCSKKVNSGNVWIWTSDWWVSSIKRLMTNIGYDVWPSFLWCKSNPPPSFRKKCLVSACEFLVMGSIKSNFFNLSEFPKQRNWYERSVLGQKERIKENEKDINKAQKPIDITSFLIRAGSKKYGLVIDAFGGTGTTLICCDRLDRKCIYIDSDIKQVKKSIERLEKDRLNR